MPEHNWIEPQAEDCLFALGCADSSRTVATFASIKGDGTIEFKWDLIEAEAAKTFEPGTHHLTAICKLLSAARKAD